MKSNDIANNLLNRLNLKDGGFILDDSLPDPIFAEADATEEEKLKIQKINEYNLNKYFGIEN